MQGVTTTRTGYTVLNRRALFFAAVAGLIALVLSFEFNREIKAAPEAVAMLYSNEVQPVAYNDGRVAPAGCVIDHKKFSFEISDPESCGPEHCHRRIFRPCETFWQRGPIRRAAAWSAKKVHGFGRLALGRG